MRREREAAEVARLAALLPYPAAVSSALDRGSVLRLALCFLQTKHCSRRGEHRERGGAGCRSEAQGQTVECSGFREERHECERWGLGGGCTNIASRGERRERGVVSGREGGRRPVEEGEGDGETGRRGGGATDLK